MDILAALFAILGSFLVTSKKRKTRFWAFMSFNVANVMWITLSMCQSLPAGIMLQSCIFLLSSIIGTINNSKKDLT